MKNKLIGLIGIILIVLVIGLIMNSDDKKNEEKVKIGIALPLSGPVAFLGESSRDAAIMALEDMGDTKYQYKLVIEDDAFDSAKTVSAANKFISIDNVIAMITFGSGTANAVNPIAESSEVSNFGLASDPNAVKGQYNFTHWTAAFTQGEFLADEIVNGGYKTVSIVDTNHDGIMAVTNAVRNSLANTDVEILTYDVTNLDDRDFRTVAQKIKIANPELIVLEQISPAIEIMTKQLRELGVNTPITSVEAFAWSNELELFEGLWFIADAKIDERFVDKFENRFGYEPQSGSTYVYDLVTLIIQTQEQSDRLLSSQEFNEIISNIDSYESKVFGNVPINEEGFFITEASVKKIENGKVVYVD